MDGAEYDATRPLGPANYPLLTSDDRYEVVEQRWWEPPCGGNEGTDWSQPVKAVERGTRAHVWLWRAPDGRGPMLLAERLNGQEREDLALGGWPAQIIDRVVAERAARFLAALDDGGSTADG